MEIIPGLPEDLGMQCLARVPYRFHANLRAVSKSWNALLSCSHLSEEGLVSLHISRRIESDFDVIIYYPLKSGGKGCLKSQENLNSDTQSIIIACSLDRHNSWLWWGFSTGAATQKVC
ncbi:hypothetical protein SUGI_0244570 [Cryptomeria japonica]|nr:hypothetical protein SUGI_0244570 [Cryptomeria japonica]